MTPVATHIELRREAQQGGGRAGDIEPVDAPVPRDRPRQVAIQAERVDCVWVPVKRLAQAVSSTPGVALLETEPGQERQRTEVCPRLGQPHSVGERRVAEVTLEKPGHVLDLLDQLFLEALAARRHDRHTGVDDVVDVARRETAHSGLHQRVSDACGITAGAVKS